MRFLTCEPNLKQKVNYKDEADQFYDSPMQWLRSHVPSYPPAAKPTHVVLYEPLVTQIKDFLVDYKRLYVVANGEVMRKMWNKLQKILLRIFFCLFLVHPSTNW